MKTSNLAFLFTPLAAALLLAACGAPPAPPVIPETTPQVGFVVAKQQAFPIEIEMPGRTTPVMIAEVRPQVGGLIQKRLFTEGSEVKAGQLLYQIDPASYAATVDREAAAVAKARAAVEAARLKERRIGELAAIKASSEQDADDARTALQQAEADVGAAEAALRTAKIDLARTRVTAPIDGRIGRSGVTPGALVTASQTAPLATVQKLDPIHVDLTQSGTEAQRLKRAIAEGKVQPGGMKVNLMFEDGSRYGLEGRLQFTEVSVDEATGSVTLRAEFPNPRGELLPGMYVRATVDAGRVDDAMLLPQQAVTHDAEGKALAYVISADRRLEPRTITPRRAIGDQWLLTGEAIKPGERVAVSGVGNVKPGAVVEAVPQGAEQPAAPAGAAPAAAAAH